MTLKRNKELQVDPEKTRDWQRRSRKRMKSVSDKRRGEWPEHDRVRAAVFARDGHRCMMVELPGECFGGLTFQHIKKASQGGKYTVANGLCACAFHNGLVESTADAARMAKARGWVR